MTSNLTIRGLRVVPCCSNPYVATLAAANRSLGSLRARRAGAAAYRLRVRARPHEQAADEISILGHALLGLLAAHELTGYELTQTFDISLAHVWSASHSQIYPELAKLQAAGLIRHTAPVGARAYLRSEAARHREQLAEYDAIAAQIQADAAEPLRWSRTSLEAGIRYERAMAEWAEWAEAELRSRAPK